VGEGEDFPHTWPCADSARRENERAGAAWTQGRVHAPATLEMKLVIVLLAPAVLAFSVSTAAAFSPQLQPAGHAASFVAQLAPGSIFSRGPLRRFVAQVGEKPPRRLLGHSWVLAKKSSGLGVAQDDRQPRGQNRVVAHITQLKAQGPSRTCNESKEEEESVAHVKRQTPQVSEAQSPTTTLVLRFGALLIATVIEAVVWAMGAQG